jgi:hypothetical protein
MRATVLQGARRGHRQAVVPFARERFGACGELARGGALSGAVGQALQRRDLGNLSWNRPLGGSAGNWAIPPNHPFFVPGRPLAPATGSAIMIVVPWNKSFHREGRKEREVRKN